MKINVHGPLKLKDYKMVLDVRGIICVKMEKLDIEHWVTRKAGFVVTEHLEPTFFLNSVP